MADTFEPFFLPVEPGDRFCIYHAPRDGVPPRGGVVYVHSFAEEMNKARRMAALQSRRLAAAGYGVIRIDLAGCGDSSGDFADARWSLWRRDVLAGAAWVRQRTGGTLVLWGLRLGAALAAEVASEPDAAVDELVLWQPVASGEQFLTQFLRLQIASQMLAAGSAQTGVREMRAALARGEALEVAGYDIHPELAAALDGVKLADLAPAARRVHWLDVGPPPEPKIAPASQRVLDAWRARGVEVRAQAVPGDPFWSTLEITDCPALLDVTDAALGVYGHR